MRNEELFCEILNIQFEQEALYEQEVWFHIKHIQLTAAPDIKQKYIVINLKTCLLFKDQKL